MNEQTNENTAAELHDELFTELLACFINETEPLLPDCADIGGLVAAAYMQNLLPVLAWLDRKWRLFGSGELSSTLKRTVYANASRRHAFGLLSKKLTEGGIAHLPVKGLYLAELYPIPELRTFGDIDILIRPGDRNAVHKLLVDDGFTVETDWEPTYSYRRGAEFYEVHTNIMDKNISGAADMKAYFASAWEHSRRRDGLLYELSPEFHFIYIFCHLAKHLYGGGAGMRMYLDAALFVKRHGEGMDWRYVSGELESLGLGRFFATVMNALKCWFGTEPPLPLPEADVNTLDELKRFTLGADLFGHARDRSAVRIRNAGSTSRTGLILRRIFPPAEDIEARYTFIKGRRWLLPAAWAARLFTNASRVRKEAEGMKRLAQTDNTAVMSHDAFMKKIGL